MIEGSSAGTDAVRTELASYALAENTGRLTFAGTGSFSVVGSSVSMNSAAANGGSVKKCAMETGSSLSSVRTDALEGGTPEASE